MTLVGGNYSLVRLRPDPESGEFANIGVVFVVSEACYLDYRLTEADDRRILDFFGTIGSRQFGKMLTGLEKQLSSLARPSVVQRSLSDAQSMLQRQFDELIRPREGTIVYSSARAILTDHPQRTLEELFFRLVTSRSSRSDRLEDLLEGESVEMRSVLREET